MSLKERIKQCEYSKSIALCLECAALIKEKSALSCVREIDIHVRI